MASPKHGTMSAMSEPVHNSALSFGFLVSFAFAATVFFLMLLFPIDGLETAGMFDFLLPLLAAIPLSLAWLAVLAWNYRKNTAPGLLLAMFMLPVAGLSLGAWAASSHNQSFSRAQERAYPLREEIHFNFSGQAFFPDFFGVKRYGERMADRSQVSENDSLLMPADERKTPLLIWRDYVSSNYELAYDKQEHQGYAYLYSGGRINAEAQFFARETDEQRWKAMRGRLAPAMLFPLQQPAYFPEMEGEASLALKHVFYHYPDRTEVAAILPLDAIAPAGQVQLAVFMEQEQPITRLQLAGREILLQQVNDNGCKYHAATIVLPIEAQGNIRWHGNEVPFDWQQAALTWPQFSRMPDEFGKQGTYHYLDVYIHADGSASAQRALLHHGKKAATFRVMPAAPLALPKNCQPLQVRVGRGMQMLAS